MTEQAIVTAPASTWRYPQAGDPLPPGGSKVLLLTIGHVCVSGPWTDDGRYVAWAPLPKRDKSKEQALRDALREVLTTSGNARWEAEKRATKLLEEAA
jgi:hypothetical protein